MESLNWTPALIDIKYTATMKQDTRNKFKPSFAHEDLSIHDKALPRFREEPYVERTRDKKNHDLEADPDLDHHNSDKRTRIFVIKDRVERRENGFRCIEKECKAWVSIDTPDAGTQHRNHCNCCLVSKHLDLKTPGDRKANCGSKMIPVAIALKPSDDELMIVHKCLGCHAIQPNRIAGDDNIDKLITLAEETFNLSRSKIMDLGIAGLRLVTPEERETVITSLKGQ